MSRPSVYTAAVMLFALVATENAQAGLFSRAWSFGNSCYSACMPCGDSCAPTQCAPIERTVYVPSVTWEERNITVTQCRPEQRTRMVTVYRRVPEVVTRTAQYSVCVPEQHTRTVNYTVQKPVWTTQTREYNVCVPQYVKRTATRRVCHMVPVRQTRTIVEDHGHWDIAACDTGCGYSGCGYGGCGYGGCGGCGGHRVWVSKPVERQVAYTCYKPEWSEQPYEYTDVQYTTETRTRQVRLCNYESEVRSRQVAYTTYRTEVRERTYDVTLYKCVPDQVEQQYTVMVPYQVQKTIRVPVCQMVPKTVKTLVACCW